MFCLSRNDADATVPFLVLLLLLLLLLPRLPDPLAPARARNHVSLVQAVFPLHSTTVTKPSKNFVAHYPKHTSGVTPYTTHIQEDSSTT